MPPDRNAPSGTSAIIRRRTASVSSVSNSSVSSRSLPWFGLGETCVRDLARVPEALEFRLAAPRQSEHGARLELVDAFIDRVRRGDVIEPHEARRDVAIDAWRPAGMGAQRLELRTEQEQIAKLGPIERLDAEPVAHQRERALAPIPQRDCEHSDQPAQRRFDAKRGERFQNDFGVGMAAKRNAARGQRRPHVLVAVNLAVVDDDVAAIGRDHRLMAGGRQIDDRQPAMDQSNAGLPINPHAVVVRPAVPHGFAHRSGDIVDRPRRALRPACNKARDTAHPLNPNLSLA